MCQERRRKWNRQYCVDTTIQRPEEYTKKSKESLVKAAINRNSYIRTKRKRKEKNNEKTKRNTTRKQK